MPNYQNGKIYKLTSEETELVYIGSTCNTLKQRLGKHKSIYRTSNKNITSKLLLKYADVKIELIENFPCNEHIELLFREGEICKNTPNHCNIRIEGRTMKEYRDDNKEKLKKYRDDNKEKLKKYRDDNKENLKEKRKIYVIKNKDKIAEKVKKYKENNKDKIAEKKKIYVIKNKDIIAEKRKIYDIKNKDKIAEKQKIYAIKNREAISAKKKISNAIKIKCIICECEITKCNLSRHLKSKFCKSI